MSVASSRSLHVLATGKQTPTRMNPTRPTSPAPLVVDALFAVTITGLTARTCRWPLWGHDDRPNRKSLYCGLPPLAPDQPYCAAHAHLAYKEPR